MKEAWIRFRYLLLLGGCKLVGLLPYRVVYYGLVPLIWFIVYRVFHYRKKVVVENLRNSFPEKSEAEIGEIKAKFYRHLAELFVDTLTLSSISEHRIRQRFRFLNNEAHEAAVADRSWICAMAHCGSWEYTISYALYTRHRVGAVYRPLHNRVFDRYYSHLRTRFGAIPVPMDEVAREMIRTKKENLPPMAVAMIADQTPPWFTIRHWFDFLHQPTPFFMGIEKLALKYRLPVYFLKIRKGEPGFYTADFVPLYDGEEAVEEFEITARYARMLEEMIRQRPELWLWSHKRWKHKPEV
jgi:KDO2-lipid IV(A) lauroyltransferase